MVFSLFGPNESAQKALTAASSCDQSSRMTGRASQLCHSGVRLEVFVSSARKVGDPQQSIV
jgi:hypothetical protein